MKPESTRTAQFLLTSLTTGLAASAGNAATVQITLIGNQLTNGSSGNHLRADITGDNQADLVFTNFHPGFAVEFKIGGDWLAAGYNQWYDSSSNLVHTFFADAKFANGLGEPEVYNAQTPQARTFFNFITLNDPRINGGAATQGYLQVDAHNNSGTSSEVNLLRVIFDDASTVRPAGDFAAMSATFSEFTAVPEPSGFALLALGAGGLLARRRRLAAA